MPVKKGGRTTAAEAFLGFDPGGRGKFGWAVLLMPPGIIVDAGTSNDVDEAIKEAKETLSGRVPLAAGIDSPLLWPKRGDRGVDQLLRKKLLEKLPRKKTAGRVQAVNSLRGACLAQGILLAHELRRHWRGIRLTECHPKIVKPLLGVPKGLPARVLSSVKGRSQDEKDAATCALSAWAMMTAPRGWEDLFGGKDATSNLFSPIGCPRPGYWMPVSSAAIRR